jgi:hypothetical protein
MVEGMDKQAVAQASDHAMAMASRLVCARHGKRPG